MFQMLAIVFALTWLAANIACTIHETTLKLDPCSLSMVLAPLVFALVAIALK